MPLKDTIKMPKMNNKIWKEKLESLKKNLKGQKEHKKILEYNIEELEFLIDIYNKKISSGR